MTGLSCGIVGLPNVGKSTLFNALTKKMAAAAANYPFCTIDPNIGVVEVDDCRLQELSKISSSKKIIPASVTFVDIAGLVKGASVGEGLGNQFLTNIRETDAIVQVVRCFEDPDVIHVAGNVNPLLDIEVINMELILSDIQMIDNILPKLEKQMKVKKELIDVHATLQKALIHLNNNLPLRAFKGTEEEIKHIHTYAFLTSKKIVYVANVDETSLPSMENDLVRAVQKYAEQDGASVIPICAKLEEELSQLSPVDAEEYLLSLGIKETGLTRLIRSAFSTLGLITYITTGEIETRAWPILKGMTAQEAAGKIHSDIQKGFIRAEVVSFTDMVTYQGRVNAREAGKARAEGKEYIVQDGDVILFYHN
ncbi:redox-regulated ATPase YchF [Rhabdochlamydiaceae symbiont of Dictyostelium giganteum]|uniref:redox-regulated ATPase YchF n=1 Tax=Rhabdochlamydiaceae symbiont of Dictyostelium giganteum TaxID=3342349 RepID=UPI00385174CC